MIRSSSLKNKSCTKKQNRELSIFPSEDDGNGKPAGRGGKPECNALEERWAKYSLKLPMEASFECKQFSDFHCPPPINNKMFPSCNCFETNRSLHLKRQEVASTDRILKYTMESLPALKVY